MLGKSRSTSEVLFSIEWSVFQIYWQLLLHLQHIGLEKYRKKLSVTETGKWKTCLRFGRMITLIKTNLLPRLQAQTLSDATPSIDKINLFSKIAVTFVPII